MWPNSGNLRKLAYILSLVFLLLSPTIWAEVVTLRTGQTITGEILLQNEEVVIIRTKSGTRYQYPATEILSISQEKTAQSSSQEAKKRSPRPIDIRFQASGGAVYASELGWGGQMAVDFMLGTKKIQDRRIFLGAGIGYRAKFLNHTTYSFLPLQAIVSMPLLDQTHAPVLGMSIGYGFALNPSTQGGICTAAELAWNYTISPQTDLQLGAFAEWQQAQLDVIQTINGNEYITHMGCNFLAIGVKLAISF